MRAAAILPRLKSGEMEAVLEIWIPAAVMVNIALQILFS